MRAHRIGGGYGHRSGFTLTEVVVAVTILALALGVLYESFGWSLRRTIVLENREEAWLTAQSLLAQIRQREALRAGQERGRTREGYEWQTELRHRPAEIDERSPIQAYDVIIEVSWGSRPAQRVRIESVETGNVGA